MLAPVSMVHNTESLDGIHKKFPISECPAIFCSCVYAMLLPRKAI